MITEFEAPWLIFEFMKHGDLTNVLRNGDRKCVFFDTSRHAVQSEESQGESHIVEEKLQLTTVSDYLHFIFSYTRSTKKTKQESVNEFLDECFHSITVFYQLLI